MSRQDIIETFNSKARETFAKNIGTLDLYPMKDREKCMLEEGVLNYLDSINNNEIHVLDSFYIRNYHFSDLGSIFSFVLKNDKFYFLYQPRFYSYASNEFYGYKQSLDESARSRLAISKINSGTIDAFLEQEVFTGGNPQMQYKKGMKILPWICMVGRSEDLGSFHHWLDEQPAMNKEAITEVLAPIFERKQTLTGNADYFVTKLEYTGYVFCDFHLIDEATPNITVDMYFLPFTDSRGFQYQTDEKRFPNCFGK